MTGRLLAIDYGRKRTGLAWTDISRLTVNPLPTVETGSLLKYLTRIIPGEMITEIVIGMPYHADGNPMKLSKEIKNFAARLKKQFDFLVIHYLDESFSTREAMDMAIRLGVNRKAKKDKGKIDQISAMIILNNYLNQN